MVNACTCVCMHMRVDACVRWCPGSCKQGAGMQDRLNWLEYSLEFLQLLPSAFSPLVPCMWP